MLNALIRFSLAQRALVLASAIILLGVGIYKVTKLPVEVLPDLMKPTITILTEAPGYAPEEVETRITVPLENTLMGAAGGAGLPKIHENPPSVLFLGFRWGTGIYVAPQFVQEGVAGGAGNLGMGEDTAEHQTPNELA